MSVATLGQTQPVPPFDPYANALRVITFIERTCVHIKGDLAGQPFKLLDWQKKFILELFRLDPETGNRQHTYALLGVPKKNGKSTLCAALGLYFLLADGEAGPEVIIASNSKEQARLIFDTAHDMVKASPILSKVCYPYRSEIRLKDKPGYLKTVSAAIATNDGRNISALICDEFHEFTPGKGDRLYEVLAGGMLRRRQPMAICITTAGHDIDGTICGRMYQRGKQIEAGEIIDPTTYFKWFEAPADLDYREPAAWQAANPSYGIELTQKTYERELVHRTQSYFERYYLNRWVATEEYWIKPDDWKACYSPLPLDTETTTYVAIDASYNNDSTAVITAQWHDEKLRIRCALWERPINPATGKPEEGWLVPYDEVIEYVRDLTITYPVTSIGFDPRFVSRDMKILADEGLPVEEIAQSATRMAPPTHTFYEMIQRQRIEHDGDPALARHVANATTKSAGGDGYILSKTKSKKKIDAAQATVMAIYLAVQPAPKKKRGPVIW